MRPSVIDYTRISGTVLTKRAEYILNGGIIWQCGSLQTPRSDLKAGEQMFCLCHTVEYHAALHKNDRMVAIATEGETRILL